VQEAEKREAEVSEAERQRGEVVKRGFLIREGEREREPG